MNERDLYLLNFMNRIAGVVDDALADAPDCYLAFRLGVSEWKIRIMRQHPENWTLEDVSALLLAVNRELDVSFQRAE